MRLENLDGIRRDLRDLRDDVDNVEPEDRALVLATVGRALPLACDLQAALDILRGLLAGGEYTPARPDAVRGEIGHCRTCGTEFNDSGRCPICEREDP